MCLDLRIIHTFSRVAAPCGVDLRVQTQNFCRFLDAEGMYGQIFGRKRKNLIDRRGEGLEMIAGQSCDQVDIDCVDADLARRFVGAEEIVHRMLATDAQKQIVRKRLGIDADARHAVFLGDCQLFLGDGIGTPRLHRKLIEL